MEGTQRLLPPLHSVIHRHPNGPAVQLHQAQRLVAPLLHTHALGPFPALLLLAYLWKLPYYAGVGCCWRSKCLCLTEAIWCYSLAH